ncbi:MAG TPA: flagellar biosynthetic protein FliR [Anaeromyxobacteraceae bacterium]|nr:flagellar biosynthetic protein FliR [Anaeromyxobacteraceae bacterium]
MEVSIAAAWGFGLVLLRTAGLCVTAPILAARVVPARVRLGVAFALAFAVFQGAGAPAVPPPGSLAGLAASALFETALGLLSGLAARWLLDAALAAGHVAGLSAGLGFGALVDPTTGAESNAVSGLLFGTAQAMAVALGIHREAVAWLARSVATWPPGAPAGLGDLATRVVGHGTMAVALSIRLAFPVLAAVMVGHLVLAVMGRMAPQLSLSNLGFSIAIGAGGFALYLSAPGIAELAARAAIAAFRG